MNVTIQDAVDADSAERQGRMRLLIRAVDAAAPSALSATSWSCHASLRSRVEGGRFAPSKGLSVRARVARVRSRQSTPGPCDDSIEQYRCVVVLLSGRHRHTSQAHTDSHALSIDGKIATAMAETKAMAEQEYDREVGVHGVIERMLAAALPPEQRAAAPELARRLEEHPEVAPLVDKRWGDLNESQRNIVAREVGLVARDVTGGAGSITTTGEHLH